jgi:RadC-like JAB domain
MAYRLKTFQVQFVSEPAEFPSGSPCRASNNAERIARSIYQRLDADKEHFLLLTLNNKNRVNGFKVVSTGSLTASLVHPREVWRAALHLCAAAVIFVHNHPSAEAAPSQETKKSRDDSRKRATCSGYGYLITSCLVITSGSSRSATKGCSSRLTFALHCEGLGKLAALTLPCRVPP